MKASILSIVLCLSPLCAGASDAPVSSWLSEINRDVWVPFLKGVESDQEALYLEVHSKDYVRVHADGDLVLTFDDYVDDTRTMMSAYRKRGVRIVIEPHFEERIVNGSAASERGVTRITMTENGKEPQTFYGRFHTILRKEDARWRIVTEYFAKGGATEAEFEDARAMDDVAGYCYMAYPAKQRICDAPGNSSSGAASPRR